MTALTLDAPVLHECDSDCLVINGLHHDFSPIYTHAENCQTCVREREEDENLRDGPGRSDEGRERDSGEGDRGEGVEDDRGAGLRVGLGGHLGALREPEPGSYRVEHPDEVRGRQQGRSAATDEDGVDLACIGQDPPSELELRDQLVGKAGGKTGGGDVYFADIVTAATATPTSGSVSHAGPIEIAPNAASGIPMTKTMARSRSFASQVSPR